MKRSSRRCILICAVWRVVAPEKKEKKKRTFFFTQVSKAQHSSLQGEQQTTSYRTVMPSCLEIVESVMASRSVNFFFSFFNLTTRGVTFLLFQTLELFRKTNRCPGFLLNPPKLLFQREGNKMSLRLSMSFIGRQICPRHLYVLLLLHGPT